MQNFGASKSYFKIYNTVIFTYKQHPNTVQHIKKALEQILQKKCTSLWTSLRTILGPKGVFQIIHYYHLCFYIVPYNYTKFQKSPQSGFLEESVQGLSGKYAPYLGKTFFQNIYYCHLFNYSDHCNHCIKSHKKILRLHSENKVYKILGSILGKNAP